jgi:exopolysaccharide biosynthesis polyprenyl glycosylphosphotransferase
MPPSTEVQQRSGAWSLQGPWPRTQPRTSRERFRYWKLATLAVDVLMLGAAALVFELALPARESVPPGWMAVFSLLILLLLSWRGMYASRLRVHFLDDLPRLVSATAAAAMALITIRVALGADPVAAHTVQYWLVAVGCLTVGRGSVALAQAQVRRRDGADSPTLIVGAGKVSYLIARRLLERPQLGLRPIGFLDKEPLEIDSEIDVPVLGASWDLDRIISEHGVEHVIVTFSTAPHHVMLNLTRRCWELGVPVSLVPRLFEVEGRRITVEHLGGVPLVSLDGADPKGWRFSVKYAVDRALAGVSLLLLSPLLLSIAAAIRLTMGRPIFYRQMRVGVDGHLFEMLKFRTMTGRPEDAGEADVDWAVRELGGAAETSSRNGQPATRTDEAADRRTPIGTLLRKFSLDELPQIFNVLRGDMSLVGPRPERVSYVERFEGQVYRYEDRHRVKSGITGWAQVNGLRGKTSLADRVEWDNYYVENWSPWLDLKIVILTVVCVLRGQSGEG